MDGPTRYYPDPGRMLFGLAVMVAVFLSVWFNWTGRWKSSSARRLCLLACTVGMVLFGELLLEALLRPSSWALRFALWVVAALSLVAFFCLAVASFLARDEP